MSSCLLYILPRLYNMEMGLWILIFPDVCFNFKHKKWRFLTRCKRGKWFLGNCCNWFSFTVTRTKILFLFHVWLKTMQNYNTKFWNFKRLLYFLKLTVKKKTFGTYKCTKSKLLSARLVISAIYNILFTFPPEMKIVQHFLRKRFVTH